MLKLMDDCPPQPAMGPQTSGNKRLTGAQPGPLPHLAGGWLGTLQSQETNGLNSSSQQLLFLVASGQNFEKGGKKNLTVSKDPGASVYLLIRATRDAQGCEPRVGRTETRSGSGGGAGPRESRLGTATPLRQR